MRSTCHALVAGLLALLTGCAHEGGAPRATVQDGPSFTATGSLDYPARLSVPPGSRMVVELREGEDGEGRPVAQEWSDLTGRRIPLPFTLRAPRKDLAADRCYRVRAALFMSGRPTWVTEPLPVDPRSDPVDLGEIAMRPAGRGDFASVLACGDESIRLSWDDELLLVATADETFEMQRVESASGARYVAIGDPKTTLWNEGDETRWVRHGEERPLCVPAVLPPRLFRAHGTEPAWSLDVIGRDVTLRMGGGDTLHVAGALETAVPGGRQLEGVSDGVPLSVRIRQGLCEDEASGRPYPFGVDVRLSGRELEGCGGDPAVLLQGETWIVEELDGGKVPEDVRITLVFGPEGRVVGAGPCNSYTGHVTVEGEHLRIGPVAATRMMCEPERMRAEQTYFGLLGKVDRFEFEDEAEIRLLTTDGRSLGAHREEEVEGEDD